MKSLHRVVQRLLVASAIGGCCCGASDSAAQVVAPSTFAAGIRVASDPPEPAGEEFDDWAEIPVALTDPEDNPDVLNLIDIKDVQIANDDEFIYVHVSYYNSNSAGAYLSFDTDQDVFTGYDIFGLGLVGAEISYVNDFPFDQRTPGVFNDNDPNTGNCCVGGPLEVNNGGSLLFPGYDQPGLDREWAIPLDAMFNVNQPFDLTFPNPTFDVIVWTDQGVSDVTETITYTLAEAPTVAGDFDGDLDVDGADHIQWQREFGGALDASDLAEWEANFGTGVNASAAIAAIPEPCTLLLAAVLLSLPVGGLQHRRHRQVR